MTLNIELAVGANDEDTLWRFMDVSKFLDLILYKHLVFPRFDQFEDIYEGHAGNFVDLICKEYIQRTGSQENLSLISWIYTRPVKISNYFSYISCWHLSAYESAAMWKLYCTTPESLAIKTNVKFLKQAFLDFPEGTKVEFSKVIYKSNLASCEDIIDRISPNKASSLSPFNALLVKRESFEHEKEYRILLVEENDRKKYLYEYYDKPLSKYLNFFKQHDSEALSELPNNAEDLDIILKGLKEGNKEQQIEKRAPVKTISIDPALLIQEIVVSPYSPKWFVDTVKELVKQLEYNFKGKHPVKHLLTNLSN